MIAWLLGAGACLLAGLAATWFLYRKRLPRERRIAGRALLAAMGHADFMQLVLAVLNGRGYERTFGGGGTDGEYLLERNGQPWLLSSRHSRAYAPGSTAIAEFSSHLRQRGLGGGLLAIPGRFPRAAFGLARAHRIELLDADSMWNELQPLLDDAQHAAIDRPARARLAWQFALAWLAALAIGAAVYLADQRVEAGSDTSTPAPMAAASETAKPAPAPAATAPGPANPTSAAPAAAPVPVPAQAAGASTAAPASPVATDPAAADLARRRNAIADAVARLPHVRSASWPAPSTLQVVVDSELFDPRARLCPLLEDDPDLRASRLQVQYPAGSARAVRFLQCRAY